MKESKMNFHNRYSYVFFQAQAAIFREIRLTRKSPNVQRISQITGFSEENILESLEFGNPDDKLKRFQYSERLLTYKFS